MDEAAAEWLASWTRLQPCLSNQKCLKTFSISSWYLKNGNIFEWEFSCGNLNCMRAWGLVTLVWKFCMAAAGPYRTGWDITACYSSRYSKLVDSTGGSVLSPSLMWPAAFCVTRTSLVVPGYGADDLGFIWDWPLPGDTGSSLLTNWLQATASYFGR